MLKTPNFKQDKKIFMQKYENRILQVEAETQEEAEILFKNKIREEKILKGEIYFEVEEAKEENVIIEDTPIINNK
jgi:hypothetical protein